jgi:IMP dehydrogenase
MNLDDIYLIPRVVSNIISREAINTSVTIGNAKLKMPIIASPMRDVCDGAFGQKLVRNGCYGILHRFSSIEEQHNDYCRFHEMAAAIGVNGDFVERFEALYNAGCRVFCVDTANGANILVKKCIEKLIGIHDDVKFIVGNVASAETFVWCANLDNVIGVRVGIAGGNACTTKDSTGVYQPMGSLIKECRKVKDEGYLKALIIADGGIKNTEHFCKALAIGADVVMLGSVLAAASDSPADLIKRDGRFYKVYHGSASFEIQSIYRDKPKYIEGKTVLLDFNNETLEQIVARFSDGLRSSMSYFDAKNLEEFRHKQFLTT